MPVDSALSLESVSFLLVWTAIAIYALAFIAYVVDLSRRSVAAVSSCRSVQERHPSMARRVLHPLSRSFAPRVGLPKRTSTLRPVAARVYCGRVSARA